jgi:arylsulfatase
MPIERQLIAGSTDFGTDRWLLFDLEEDFAEVVDRSESHPDVVAALVALWDEEAEVNHVLPLDDSMLTRLASLMPSPNPPRPRFVFRGGSRIAEDASPPLGGDFVLTADLESAATDVPVEGVIAAQGNWTSGWALYVHEGVPTFVYNDMGTTEHVARAGATLPSGRRQLGLVVTRDGDVAQLSWTIDDRPAGTGTITTQFPLRWQIGGSMLRIGYDAGLPVTGEYAIPGHFPGIVHSVTFEIPLLAALLANETRDAEREVSTAMRGD